MQTLQPRRQRQHVRAPCDGTVALCRGRDVELVRAEDIGEGGAFLRTSRGFSERSLLTLHIRLPGTPGGFTVLCRVVRSQGQSPDSSTGAAVEFLDILPSQRRCVASYVEQRAPAAPPALRAAGAL